MPQGIEGEFCRGCKCTKYLRWTANGVQEKRAAKTRSWPIAEGRRRDIETQYEAESNPESNVHTSTTRTLRQLVELCLVRLRNRDNRPDTLAKNERELGRFVSFCVKGGNYFAEDVDEVVLLRYAASWEAIYPSASTRNLIRTRLNKFLLFCVRLGELRVVPEMEAVLQKRELTLPLSDQEYSRLLNAASDGERKVRSGIPRSVRRR